VHRLLPSAVRTKHHDDLARCRGPDHECLTSDQFGNERAMSYEYSAKMVSTDINSRCRSVTIPDQIRLRARCPRLDRGRQRERDAYSYDVRHPIRISPNLYCASAAHHTHTGISYTNKRADEQEELRLSRNIFATVTNVAVRAPPSSTAVTPWTVSSEDSTALPNQWEPVPRGNIPSTT